MASPATAVQQAGLNFEDLETEVVNAVGQQKKGGRSSSHHMVIRETPAWSDAARMVEVPVAESQISFISTDSNVDSLKSHNGVGSTVSPSPYQHFLSQLGPIPYEEPGGEVVTQNVEDSKVHPQPEPGYDNPGFVGDSSAPSNRPAAVQQPNGGFNSFRSAGIALVNKSLDQSSKSFREDLYFNDATKKIDLVLVYEDDYDLTKEKKRRAFLRNLEAEGLHVELENSMSIKRGTHDAKTHFAKIHAPWTVLTKYAEIMNVKMPVKKFISISYKAWDKSSAQSSKKSKFRGLWQSMTRMDFFEYNHARIPPEPSFYMASFQRQKEECFIIKDRETFFTSAQRSQIVWKILTRVRYEENSMEKAGVGIRRLLNDDTFVASFPLHDGPWEEEAEEGSGQPNDRRLLYTEWAHFSNWYKKQPLWLVRRYFGDKVALYFAWLGFYTGMLVPASIVGILCFLFGIATIHTDYNTPSRDICDETRGGNITMCPLCEHCELWKLYDSCTFSKLTYFFDNPATVFFAIFMAFWATSFLEFWKRKHAVIAWEWDIHNYEVEEEPRPEFEAAVKTFRINPVTQQPEPYLSFWNKAFRMLAVSSIVFLLLFIVSFVVVGIIIFRLLMMGLLYSTTMTDIVVLKNNAKIIASVFAAVLNLVIVVFLHNRVYYKLAIWLTNSEFPRTQTEYEDSFTFKMFLFQFINYYSYLIYIAFFKGRFFRHPGEKVDNPFEKIRGDMCDPAGCLSELFIQLSIIMIGKQFFNNFMELFAPKVSNWCRRMRYTAPVGGNSSETPVFFTRWEQDYQLKKVDQLALFQEYLEMVIQYGFVTLFVAAFPLAPFFALLNNIVEIRLDAYKWITQLRRPMAERVEDIGAWFGILQGITYMSVVTNAFVIAYTSDIIPRLVYLYTSGSSTLEGYIESSLSNFTTGNYTEYLQKTINNHSEPYCRYRGYYNPPEHEQAFQPSERYWHIMAARLFFVGVFEHVAFALTGVMAFAIPDIPKEIRTQIAREKLLATEALYENDLAKLQREKDGHFHTNGHVRDSVIRRGSSVGHDLISQARGAASDTSSNVEI